MWLLLGPRNLENIVALARSASPVGRVASDRDGVSDAYARFLAGLQPYLPAPAGGSPEFLIDGERHAAILSVFNAGSTLDDYAYQEIGGQLDEAEAHRRAAQTEQVKAGLSALARRELGYEEIFDLAFTHVVVAPCANAGGGTTSAARGILWADPRSDWIVGDVEEFVVHELAHTLVFAHELRAPLYTRPDELANERFWPLSAIRGVPRPLDKAFHSAIVSAEVLAFRAVAESPEAGGVLHPSTEELTAGLRRCVASIRELDDRYQLLTDAAHELLALCDPIVNGPDGHEVPVAASGITTQA